MATKTPTRPKRRRQADGRNASRTRGRPKTARNATASPALPGWGELRPKNERVGRARAGGMLDSVPTLRFALIILAVAASFTLYVGHVHATQDLLAEVQELRRENMRLHLQHNQTRGDYDRATGPAVVYERAHALGLEEGFHYGPTIDVE